MIVLGWKHERHIRLERRLSDEEDYFREWRDRKHVEDAQAMILRKETGVIEEVSIEVECTLKWDTSRIDWILGWHAAQGRPVWYFATDKDKTYETIKARINLLPAEDIPKFEMWRLDTIGSGQTNASPNKTPPLAMDD